MSKDKNSSEKAKPVEAPPAEKKAAVVTETETSTQLIEGAEGQLATEQESGTDGGSELLGDGEGTGADEQQEHEQEPAGDGPTDEPPVDDAAKEAAVGSTVETAGSLPPVLPPVAVTPPTLQANTGDTAILEVFNHRVDEYITHMGKGVPVSSEVGAQWQKKLFTIIDQILKLQGTLFNRAWSDLLAKVASQREGAFHESRAFRFFDKTKVDKVQLRNYQNLLHLIIHTAVPKSRQQMLKLIDIASVTRTVQIPGAADKLYAYYNL